MKQHPLTAPWTVDETFRDTDRSLLFHAIRNADGTVIASTFAGPREDEAYLIAAAPALLKALEELMASEGGEPRKDDPDSVRIWRRARAAIELAVGK